MTLDDPQDRDVAAGEFVMGTLAGDDRIAFEGTLATDAGLQALVYAWQDRLLGLASRAAPVTPATNLWARIEQQLPEFAARSAANDGPPSPASPPAAPRGQLRLWRTLTGLALAASVVLASVLVVRSLPDPAPARYLALLQAPDKSTGWIVEVTAGQRVRLVPIAPGVVPPPDKALQFWTKPEGAAGPTSLGLVRAGEVVELPVSRLPGLGEKQLFELTLEPAAGSPIDRPTGPILYVGSTVRL